MSTSFGSASLSTIRADGSAKASQSGSLCYIDGIPKIDRSQIDGFNSTRLGEGTYGYVMKCRFRQTPDSSWRNIAIKYGTDPSRTQQLIREARIMFTQIHHPNCIRIFGLYDCPKNGIGVAMELMDCNLADLIAKRNIEYKIEHAISWLHQLADAVNYFHMRDLVHGDLKLQNLLLCNRYQTLKVCDFGTLTTIHDPMALNHGTPLTMAPEIIKGCKKYTTKCDIFSLGIIMWQIIARRESPYPASHPHDAYVIYWNIVSANLRPPKLSCDVALSWLYERSAKLGCWHDDPAERPTSFEVLEQLTNLIKSYPDPSHDLIDIITNEPAATSQLTMMSCKSAPPWFHSQHTQYRLSCSPSNETDEKMDQDIAQETKENDDHTVPRIVIQPEVKSKEISKYDDRTGPSNNEEMPYNVLEHIDPSLWPADPVVGDEASEQIYSEHLAACYELYNYHLSLQRALSDKHNAVMNLAHMEEYRKLIAKKEQLQQIRDDALKRIQ